MAHSLAVGASSEAGGGGGGGAPIDAAVRETTMGVEAPERAELLKMTAEMALASVVVFKALVEAVIAANVTEEVMGSTYTVNVTMTLELLRRS